MTDDRKSLDVYPLSHLLHSVDVNGTLVYMGGTSSVLLIDAKDGLKRKIRAPLTDDAYEVLNTLGVTRDSTPYDTPLIDAFFDKGETLTKSDVLAVLPDDAIAAFRLAEIFL